MSRSLLARILRRGPTRDEAFDRFAQPTAPAAETAARANSPAPRRTAPPLRRPLGLRHKRNERQHAPSAASDN
jgi:hypothetical protein